MKKRILGVAAVAAAITVSGCMTAFAGWVSDGEGTMYQRDDGTYQDWGWFTDPDTGLEYYFDLSGYRMTNTRVEGYWLDDEGVKHEKSDAEIAAEEAKKTRLEGIRTPGKSSKASEEEALKSAEEGELARSTNRKTYQNEMAIFTNRAFVEIKRSLAADGNTNYSGSISSDSEKKTYYYDTTDKVRVLYGSIWQNANEKSQFYVPYAYELNYNRNIIHGEESQYFNDGFKSMVIAALGETEGTAVYDKIMAVEVGSDDRFEQSGTTDSGNTYVLTYRYNNANIKVTCTELVTEDESAEESVEETTVDQVEETQAVTTSAVIAAGSGASVSNNDETTTEAVDAEIADADDSEEE